MMRQDSNRYKGTNIPVIEFKLLWFNDRSSRVELELSESLGYDDFDQFVEIICEIVIAKIVKQIDGPDARICEIKTSDNKILLIIYDDFPNRGLITSFKGVHDDLIIELFESLPYEKKYDYRIH